MRISPARRATHPMGSVDGVDTDVPGKSSNIHNEEFDLDLRV